MNVSISLPTRTQHLVTGTPTGGKQRSRWLVLTFVGLSNLLFLSPPDAQAGNATISEVPSKAVVTGPTESPDFITGGQGDIFLTEGFYSSTLVPRPRRPTFNFVETDLQLGYMLPIIGGSFYRGNFEGLANLFVWPVVHGPGGVLGGGALGLRYNLIQPGWRLVPYLGLSLGLSGNNIFTHQNQTIIGGPFEFVLQGNIGARYFFGRDWGLIFEYGFQR